MFLGQARPPRLRKSILQGTQSPTRREAGTWGVRKNNCINFGYRFELGFEQQHYYIAIDPSYIPKLGKPTSQKNAKIVKEPFTIAAPAA